MWILTIRSAQEAPYEHILKPGTTILGRKADNDIPLPDTSASRLHAELVLHAETNAVTIRDLGSTNGTFVNRERLQASRRLAPGDEVRIGQHVITLEQRDTNPRRMAEGGRPDTSPLTRDLLLESLDRHAVLLSEVAERLATVLDVETALREVSSLMRRSMGADKCDVILAERFDHLNEMGFPTSIAQMALETRSAVILPDVGAQSNVPVAKSALLLRVRSALCVPVLSGEEIVALIYVYKTSPHFRPFNQRDLQLAVAISHQAALTIQRARLLRRVRKEQRIRELLQRFLAPSQAENLTQDYLMTGRLPELKEQVITVLFADVQDSTSLAERLGARQFSQFLGEYYQSMTDVVFEQGGLLQQFSGDGVMAVFGLFGQADHEERAVRAALAMLRRREALKASGEQVELGVGINTGPAMAGCLEIRDRIEFTVLGDTVNVCQRLQTQARPNRIFLGPNTHAALNGHFNLRAVGTLEVRGRSQPVEVYEALPG